MTNYVKLTDFAAKDALASGNPSKIVKGTEIDDEFSEVATHLATKVNKVSGALTGTPTAPNASAGSSTTQIATCSFVQGELDTLLPVGFIQLAAFATPPSGYLLADGSEVSRAGYAALFAAIGTVFGVGDGSTTFDLPAPTAPTNMYYFIKH
jgi:phage-related tail fiber protein